MAGGDMYEQSQVFLDWASSYIIKCFVIFTRSDVGIT